MSEFDVPGSTQEQFDKNIVGFRRIIEKFGSDPAFRAAAEEDATDIFKAEGIVFPAGLQVKVRADTPSVMHFVLPPDPNHELADERLEAVSGGSTLGCAGSVATASTLVCACAPSSASTMSSSGTASST